MVTYTLNSALYKIVTKETNKWFKQIKIKIKIKIKINRTKQYKGRTNITKEKTMKFYIKDEKVKYFNCFVEDLHIDFFIYLIFM